MTGILTEFETILISSTSYPRMRAADPDVILHRVAPGKASVGTVGDAGLGTDGGRHCLHDPLDLAGGDVALAAERLYRRAGLALALIGHGALTPNADPALTVGMFFVGATLGLPDFGRGNAFLLLNAVMPPCLPYP